MTVDIKYQTKQNYIHRKVGGKDILIPVAENVADFNGFIELNKAAAFIWDTLTVPHTASEVVAALSSEFGIDESTAMQDTEEFMSSLIGHKMLVEVE